MKFSFMQNPLTQIQFYAWIYNSFINSHLLEWLKVRQIKSGIRVNFDQCVFKWRKYVYKCIYLGGGKLLSILVMYLFDI